MQRLGQGSSCPAAQITQQGLFSVDTSMFYFNFYDLQLPVAFLTPALIMGSKEVLHTKAAGGVCSQHCIHLIPGSSLPVNSPRIPAAGACHQAGTPPVINPVTHQPAIPLSPNTEQTRTRQKRPARIFPLFLPILFLHTMK